MDSVHHQEYAAVRAGALDLEVSLEPGDGVEGHVNLVPGPHGLQATRREDPAQPVQIAVRTPTAGYLRVTPGGRCRSQGKRGGPAFTGLRLQRRQRHPGAERLDPPVPREIVAGSEGVLAFRLQGPVDRSRQRRPLLLSRADHGRIARFLRPQFGRFRPGHLPLPRPTGHDLDFLLPKRNIQDQEFVQHPRAFEPERQHFSSQRARHADLGQLLPVSVDEPGLLCHIPSDNPVVPLAVLGVQNTHVREGQPAAHDRCAICQACLGLGLVPEGQGAPLPVQYVRCGVPEEMPSVDDGGPAHNAVPELHLQVLVVVLRQRLDPKLRGEPYRVTVQRGVEQDSRLLLDRFQNFIVPIHPQIEILRGQNCARPQEEGHPEQRARPTAHDGISVVT